MRTVVDVNDLVTMQASTTPPVVLDVRWQLAGPPGALAYAEGHVPGAVFVDLDRDLAGPPGAGGRHPLPDAGTFESVMRRFGVHDDRPVVVYDAADATASARAWWMLRYFGHDQAYVLDGGYAAWTAAGQPVTTEAPEPAPGTFTARPDGMPLVDADGAASIARNGVLLDARTAVRYRGEQEPVDPVAGHVPAAVSAPAADNVGPDGRLCDATTLRRRFSALGVSASTPVGAYCGSGVTAAQQVLALARAGIPAALYVGSWSDWVSDSTRPVATGPDPGPPARLH